MSGCSTAQWQEARNRVEDFFNPYAELERNWPKELTPESKRMIKEFEDHQKAQAEAKKKRQQRIARENAEAERQLLANAEQNWQAARQVLGTADAIPYLHAAAQGRHPAATYHLALAFLRGQGVNVNYREAEAWMREAARLKYPAAQYAFANMCMERAKRVWDPNHIFIFLPTAYAWYTVAEHNGVRAASAPRQRIQAQLTRKVYGPDAEVNAYMWDEAQRLTADGFSKYLN